MTRQRAATVLLIAADAPTRRIVAVALQDHRLWQAESAADARAILRQRRPDVIVLDLTLPDVDGLVLCAWLHADVPDLPIVTLARPRTPEAALSLQLGAADVLVKPANAPELEARVCRVLRDRAQRSQHHARHATLGRLHVDAARWRVTLDGRRVDLTPTEFQLLAYLTRHAGQIVSRQDLARDVWGDPSMSQSRTIDAYVRRVRRKLAGRGAPNLMSVHGVGYLLGAPILTAA